MSTTKTPSQWLADAHQHALLNRSILTDRKHPLHDEVSAEQRALHVMAAGELAHQPLGPGGESGGASEGLFR
ncbi:hypothetical protein [Methylibium petroleiphilum]|uniref:hypothetical protein n=1 Tax=Methylibium petroleiphilum TaxID=105560 RepID=UPI003D2DA2ED